MVSVKTVVAGPEKTGPGKTIIAFPTVLVLLNRGTFYSLGHLFIIE